MVVPHQTPSARVTDMFFGVVREELPAVSSVLENGVVTIGSRTIRLTAELEQAGRVDDGWAVGLRVEVSLDDTPMPALTTGAVGLDSTQASAIDAAAITWGGNVGVALANAIGGSPDGFPVGQYTAYAGLPMTGGDVLLAGDIGGTPEIHQRVLAALEPLIERWATGKVTSVWFFVRKAGRDLVTGECWVGGRMVDGMPALRTLQWPTTDTSYQHKVSYVLVRRP